MFMADHLGLDNWSRSQLCRKLFLLSLSNHKLPIALHLGLVQFGMVTGIGIV